MLIYSKILREFALGNCALETTKVLIFAQNTIEALKFFDWLPIIPMSFETLGLIEPLRKRLVKYYFFDLGD